MKISELELVNFRSYRQARFELHPDVTLVVGPNASGKTNLLESLYVLASTKSFRAKDRDLIRHGQDFFRLVAMVDGVEYALGMSVAGGGNEKKITHDSAKRALSAHVGTIQVTLFEPRDLELVSGPPEGRRRYLDFILCQTDRRYLKVLQDYRRVLRQRNALLEGFDVVSIRTQVFGWDVKLAELAAEIYGQRRRFLDGLATSLPRVYGEIAGRPEQLEIEYLPSVAVGGGPGGGAVGLAAGEGHNAESEDYGSNFLDALTRNLPRDLGAGFTTIGPHREDFKIRFKDATITAVASRGETRTAVLAMKLAEMNYVEAQTGMKPVLLLDDVFSELDRERRGFLLGRLAGQQTVITTTDADAVTREFQTPHSIISTQAVGA